jgi:hypothetical protein
VISAVRVQLKGELEPVQCGSEQLVNGEDQDDLFTVKVL